MKCRTCGMVMRRRIVREYLWMQTAWEYSCCSNTAYAHKCGNAYAARRQAERNWARREAMRRFGIPNARQIATSPDSSFIFVVTDEGNVHRIGSCP